MGFRVWGLPVSVFVHIDPNGRVPSVVRALLLLTTRYLGRSKFVVLEH